MNESKDIKKFRYIQFPLCFLSEIIEFENPKRGYELIMSFGLINLAEKLNISYDNIAKQIVYNYFINNGKQLTTGFLQKIEKYIKKDQIIIDGHGFDYTGREFNVDEEVIKSFTEVFEKDKKFYDEAEFHYRVWQAAKLLEITINNMNNVIKLYEKGREKLENFQVQFGRDAWTSVRTDLLLSAKDERLSEDLFCLLAGVRSKIGRRNYVHTYKVEILNRMIGAKNDKTAEELLKNENIRFYYEKFKNRYQFNKLIDKAVDRQLLTFLSCKRGYYVSIRFRPEKLQDMIQRKLWDKPARIKYRVHKKKDSQIKLNSN